MIKVKYLSFQDVGGQKAVLRRPPVRVVAKSDGGLDQWFEEKWVDLSRPKKGGGFEPCGRPDADEGKYPKCVPASRAAQMTESEIKSAVRRKRRAESTQRREGKKPINVKTKVEKDNPTPNSVHVDSIMGSKKRRKNKKLSYRRYRMEEALAKGDCVGHPFRGNQHTGGKKGEGGCGTLGEGLGFARPVGELRRSKTTRSSENPLTDEAKANLEKVGQPVSVEELRSLRAQIVEQYNNMRKATAEDKEKHCASKQNTKRAGGDRRGSSTTRAKRRNRMLAKFGDGHTVGCAYCGIRMDYGTMEIEKLDPVLGYGERDNVIPACRGCNVAVSDVSPAEKCGAEFTRPFTDPRCP